MKSRFKFTIEAHDRYTDSRVFTEVKSGAVVEVYEYYNKTDRDEHKSYNLADVWVPLNSRGCGVGSALLREVLDYYDDRGKNLRLVTAGCCAPTRCDKPVDVKIMHTGHGHYDDCDMEGLSHHGLQRWYRSFGFVDHPEGRNDDGELCCDYLLWRPHG